MRTILFVCTGNTCRSPMAEAIARHHIEQGALGPNGMAEVFVASAGVGAGDGSPITSQTIEALTRLGIEHSGRSKPLTAQMVEKADLVFCMTAGHQAMVRELLEGRPRNGPSPMDKILPLDPAGDIEDPIGQGQEAYDSLAAKFMKLIPARLQEAVPIVAGGTAHAAAPAAKPSSPSKPTPSGDHAS